MAMIHDSTFDHLSPTEDQERSMLALREAAKAYAAAVSAHVPPGSDRAYILRKFREVAMWADVAVVREPDGTPRGPDHLMAATVHLEG
jgi:DhnA family fructose-bisphosphate aldolase class Ia